MIRARTLAVLALLGALPAVSAGCGSSPGTKPPSACADQVDGTSCDDGDACTQTDACKAGACVGGDPVSCAALDDCHLAGVCDTHTGTCTDPLAPDDAPCDLGDDCVQGDACHNGTCFPGSPIACAPADACHVAGVCDPELGACSNPPAPDGTACDDGDSCTQLDTCKAGACTGGSPVSCGPTDACHTMGACDEATGTCVIPAVPDGAPCDDGNPATTGDFCMAGVCLGNSPPAWTLWGDGQGGSTCATLGGRLRCWGLNHFGQLGLGDTKNRGDLSGEMGNNLPVVDLGTGRLALDVATCEDHTCATLDNGQLKCWGDNSFGQLGLGDLSARGDAPGEMGDSLPAVSLGTGRTVASVSASASSTCAVLDNGQLKCWGDNFYGQLGLGDTVSRGGSPADLGDSLPAVSLGAGRSAIRVALSGAFTCALLDNLQIKCWGLNSHGELGTGDTNPRGSGPGQMGDSLPAVSLGAGRTAIELAVGSDHACALLDNHQVKCWGNNPDGELGQGDTLARGTSAATLGDNLPAVSLGAGRTATALSAGGYHTCAVLDDGHLKCWGANLLFGMLGLGDANSRGDQLGEMGDALPAVDLGTGRTVMRVAAGAYLSCALLDDLAVKCWGSNSFGGLGVGDTKTRGLVPGDMGDALPVTDLGN